MTTSVREQLFEAMLLGQADRVVALCADLDEAERMSLAVEVADFASELHRAARAGEGGIDGSRKPQVQASLAAVLCTGPPQEHPFGIGPSAFLGGELVRAAVTARPRPWRDAWVKHWTSWLRWTDLRTLMRGGLVNRPHNPGYEGPDGSDYAGWLARAMTGRWANRGIPTDVYESLLADPDLLEDDVFLIFEVDFLQYRMDAGQRSVWDDWAPALLRLEAEGRISRQKLLDASLAGVEHHPKVSEIRGFAVLHGKLKPTIEEIDARQRAYLRLLESQASPAVALGLRQLGRLHRAGRGDPREILEHIHPAVASVARGIARQAVKLIDQVIANAPSWVDEGLVAALPALMSAERDAQIAVIDLLEHHGGNDVGRAELSAMLPHLDPAARRRAARLCGEREKPADQAATAVTVPDPEPLDPWVIPRLRPDTAIVPIADLDELLEATAVVLERQDDPDELERWCDGVARLCDQPVDEERARPLLRRASKGPSEPSQQSARVAVATITYHWLSAKPLIELDRFFDTGHGAHFLRTDAGPSAALNRRLALLAERAAAGNSRPLLSAPTHRGGWIDPLVLADRLTESAALDDDDLAQALLRIPPGDHKSARDRIADQSGEAMQAMRAALGDRAVLAPEVRTFPATWDAAAFVRGERATMEPPFRGPSVWTPGDPRPEQPVTPQISPIRILTLSAPVTTFPGDIAARRWLALTSPGDLSPYFEYTLAHARLEEITRVYWMKRAEIETIGPGLEPMLAPDTPLGPAAYELLATALGATTSDRILAAEVVIEAITDRRLVAHSLGSAIATAMRRPQTVPDRWAAALSDIPHVSALHAYETQRIIEATLRALQGEQLPLARLVDLLRRLVVDADARVQDDDARRWLENIPDRSKSGRAARSSLAVNGAGAARSIAAAQDAADYEARRLARWANSGQPMDMDSSDTRS